MLYKDCESPKFYVSTTYEKFVYTSSNYVVKTVFLNTLMLNLLLNLSICLSLLIGINTQCFSNVVPSQELSSVISLELNIFMVISFDFHEYTCGRHRISIKSVLILLSSPSWSYR